MNTARNILVLLFLSFLFYACKDEVKSVVANQTDPNTYPTVVSHNVKTLISDSGITQYRITTPIWNMFERATEPRWTFPQGAYLEQFNEKFKVIASIRCDSATYFRISQLWRLDGNVRVENIAEKELFLTNQLFWDQANRSVYSDSFIHVEKIDRIIEGYGFKSNEQFTNYQIFKVQAILPIDDSKTAFN